MRPPQGTALLVSLLVVYLVVLSGREFFREKSLPAVSFENCNEIRVLLEGGFFERGVHQFSDGTSLLSAIKMTASGRSELNLPGHVSDGPLLDGERLTFVVNEFEIVDVLRGWMPASQRMALGVKLHPDRMTRCDWESLPGIGPRLAERIEENRQIIGDFSSLDALKRVPGIGNKSIERWRPFF